MWRHSTSTALVASMLILVGCGSVSVQHTAAVTTALSDLLGDRLVDPVLGPVDLRAALVELELLERVVDAAETLPMLLLVFAGYLLIDHAYGGGASRASLSATVGNLRPVTPSVGGTTDGSVSSTSPMRSAETDARGSSINMNVDIITAMRI